jgi:DNA-binding NtrC family response regulator
MKKTVLIAEDDKDLLDIYGEILEINGYSVLKAKDGQEAISKFKESLPELVVMDGDMPNVNGFEAFYKIIEFDKKANVVIVTGYSDSHEKSKAMLEKGLISIISKPIGVDMLLDLAKKYSSEIVLKK